MKPEQRLDQIEPILADLLQKVDRLIETSGQLLDFSVENKAALEELKAQLNQVSITFNADLAITKADLYNALTQLRLDLQSKIEDVRQSHVALAAQVTRIEKTGESTARAVANLTVSVNARLEEMKAIMNEQYDELKSAMSEQYSELKTGQQEILILLRDKLR